MEIPDELNEEDVMRDAQRLREALQDSGILNSPKKNWEELGKFRQERHAATVLSLYAQGYRIVGDGEDHLSFETELAIILILDVIQRSRSKYFGTPDVQAAIRHLSGLLPKDTG